MYLNCSEIGICLSVMLLKFFCIYFIALPEFLNIFLQFIKMRRY